MAASNQLIWESRVHDRAIDSGGTNHYQSDELYNSVHKESDETYQSAY